jgi:hypothetical protein
MGFESLGAWRANVVSMGPRPSGIVANATGVSIPSPLSVIGPSPSATIVRPIVA